MKHKYTDQDGVTIKYRTLQSGDDSVVVILEDGGFAEVHYAEPMSEKCNRQSTTEYYQTRFTQSDVDNKDEPIYDILGEGKMYYNDWDTPFTNPVHVQDMLEWLAPGHIYKLDETIWLDLVI